MDPDSDERRRRLFFALWPDEAVREQLSMVARRWTRHPIAAANLHLTLVFLGSRTPAEQACFSAAADTIQGAAFDMALDYIGVWPRRGIRWLGTTAIPDALTGLVRQLNTVLQPCGYQAEKRHFVPHITLSRKEKNPQPRAGIEMLRWRVCEFALVESIALPDGVCYRPLQHWPLQ